MLTFSKAAKIGDWAVQSFSTWVKSQSQCEVHDVQDDKFFQLLDVDLLLESSDGIRLCEVKGDRWTSGNVYLERVSNNSKGNPGCMIYTCADVVAYYFVTSGKLLLIPVPALKSWMAEHLLSYPEKVVGTKGEREKRTLYMSTGHTVPIEVILREVPGTEYHEGLPVMQGQLQ